MADAMKALVLEQHGDVGDLRSCTIIQSPWRVPAKS